MTEKVTGSEKENVKCIVGDTNDIFHFIHSNVEQYTTQIAELNLLSFNSDFS